MKNRTCYSQDSEHLTQYLTQCRDHETSTVGMKYILLLIVSLRCSRRSYLKPWCHFSRKEQLFTSTVKILCTFQLDCLWHRLYWIESGQKNSRWVLGELFIVYSEGSSSARSPLCLRNILILHSPEVQVPKCLLCQSESFACNCNNASKKQNASEQEEWLPRPGELTPGSCNLQKGRLRRSPGPPLLGPHHRSSADAAPHSSPPEISVHHPFPSQVQTFQGRAPLGPTGWGAALRSTTTRRGWDSVTITSGKITSLLGKTTILHQWLLPWQPHGWSTEKHIS